MVIEPPVSIIVVPLCRNKSPVKVSRAVKISVPRSDLLKVLGPLMTPPKLAVAFTPTPMVEVAGMGSARLLVIPPLICKVPPLRVTAPELTPSAESLVMINVLPAIVTPPLKLLLVSNVREPKPFTEFDTNREVTPAIPPDPAILYGKEVLITIGKA